MRHYYVAPVTHGEGLTVRVGTGRDTFCHTLSSAAVAMGAQPTQVIAVWKIEEGIPLPEAARICSKIQPTKILICSSNRFGVLELSSEYLDLIEVTYADLDRDAL